MSNLEIQLVNGTETQGYIGNGIIFGNGPIRRYMPMWELDTGLCDFFFGTTQNKEMDSLGYNIAYINGVPFAEWSNN